MRNVRSINKYTEQATFVWQELVKVDLPVTGFILSYRPQGQVGAAVKHIGSIA